MANNTERKPSSFTPGILDLYFCPKGNIAKIISRTDFPKEKRETIRVLHKLDKRWNIVVPLYFALWIISAFGAIHSNLIVIDVFWYVIGGFALSTLMNLAHESTHNLFTHNPKIDRWIGFLCSVPILFSPTGYRLRHPLHHKFARSEEDPDDLERLTENTTLLSVLYVLTFIVGAYLFLLDTPIQAFKRGSRSQRIAIVLETVVMVSVLGAAWIVLPASGMVQGWLIPILIAFQIAHIRALAEHRLTSRGNEFIDTRTVLTNPVLSLLMCNINYHLEHHLYPGVPWYNLPKLHKLLQEEYQKAGSSVYTTYSEFLQDVFKVLRFGVVPGNRLIPQHVRREICL